MHLTGKVQTLVETCSMCCSCFFHVAATATAVIIPSVTVTAAGHEADLFGETAGVKRQQGGS